MNDGMVEGQPPATKSFRPLNLPVRSRADADLRVVRREVEDDVRVGVALDDVVGLRVVTRSSRVVEQRPLRLHADLLQRRLQDREQAGAERVVPPGQRDRLPRAELLLDQPREDRRLKRVRRHGAEVVAVVLEVGERRRRVVRPDLGHARGHRGCLSYRDGAPRGERPEDAVRALGDHLARGVHPALGRRSVVRVLDLDLDVVDTGLLECRLRLLDGEAGRLGVCRSEDRRRPGEGNDDADVDREAGLLGAARGRRAGDHGENYSRDACDPPHDRCALHEPSCLDVHPTGTD